MTEHEELLMLRELAAKQKQQLEEYEIKSASNESVVSITKKLLLCTTPSFEALTYFHIEIYKKLVINHMTHILLQITIIP